MIEAEEEMGIFNQLPIADLITVGANYLITVVCLVFAYQLFKLYKIKNQRSLLLWSLAFFFISLSSFSDGTYHGIKALIPESAALILWKIVIYTTGTAGFTMLAGTVIGTFSNPVRVLFLVLAASKFLSYAAWMVNHNLYLYVIIDYGSGMLGLLLLQGYSYYRRHDHRAKWIIGGVLIWVVSLAMEQSSIALNEQLNLNDFYNIVRLAGLSLFYVGARQLEDVERI